MSQVTEDLRADLSRARTWVLVNGPSADAAIVWPRSRASPVEPPDHTYRVRYGRLPLRDARRHHREAPGRPAPAHDTPPHDQSRAATREVRNLAYREDPPHRRQPPRLDASAACARE
jgi:hypothetical protein